jgi:HAD superfamily hydrolase (TIGR01509 family)
VIDLEPYRFSALIFDCDGTLAQTAGLHYRSMAVALRAQGHDIARGWYDARVGLSRHDLFADYSAQFGVALDVEAAARDSRQVFGELAHQARPIEQVVATAAHYHGRVPLAVASGGDAELVDATLRAIGALAYFDAVVTVGDVARGKPAPDLFQAAAHRLDMAAPDCLVFEDSDEGLEAARRAGMAAIDVRPLLV